MAVPVLPCSEALACSESLACTDADYVFGLYPVCLSTPINAGTQLDVEPNVPTTLTLFHE